MADKRSNVDRAVENLRAQVFSGDLAAGSDHLESELAARLNMSRTPVREAVLILESQGLLELRPRKGVRILPLSPEDMSEIYDVLTELESHAAERAAAFGYDEKALSALADSIAKMEIALLSEDREAWARADDQFHRELVRLGGNGRIVSIVNMMSDQVRRAKSTTLFMRPLPTKSNADHRAVYNAIRTGNAMAARKAHHRHRQHAKVMLVELLQRHRLKYV